MLIVGQKLFSNPGFVISFLGGTGMALTFELPGSSSNLFLQPRAQPAFSDMPLHRAAAQKPWRRSLPLPGPPPQNDNTAARYQAAGGGRGDSRGTAGRAGRGRRCSPRWARDCNLPGLRAAPGIPRMNSCQGPPHPCCTISSTAQDLRWWIGCANGPNFPPSLNPCSVPGDFAVALTMEIESISSSLECTDFD